MRFIIKSITLILLSLCILPVYAHSNVHVEVGPRHHYHHRGVYVDGGRHYHHGVYVGTHGYRNIRIPGHWVYHPRSHAKVWVPAHWERRR